MFQNLNFSKKNPWKKKPILCNAVLDAFYWCLDIFLHIEKYSFKITYLRPKVRLALTKPDIFRDIRQIMCELYALTKKDCQKSRMYQFSSCVIFSIFVVKMMFKASICKMLHFFKESISQNYRNYQHFIIFMTSIGKKGSVFSHFLHSWQVEISLFSIIFTITWFPGKLEGEARSIFRI